jgi:SAM-dependent methyltransferase
MAGRADREYWDARADEDAFYFVDNRLTYGDPDMERFWEGGREGLDLLLGDLGASLGPGDDVVEIGCGVGRMTRVLAERAASVRAVDVSARMLEIAREHNPQLVNVEWILGDGRSLASVASQSADVVHSDVVFQHIPDPQITLGYVSEIGRVLRPGGWAAFQVSNAPEIHELGLFSRTRATLQGAIGRGPRGQSNRRWRGSAVDLDDLVRAAVDAGMRVENITGQGTQYCRVLLRKPER